MKILLVVGFALLVLGSVAVAKIPEDDVERFGETNRLQWRDGETLTLRVSGGTLSAPRTVRQLVGVDARRVLTMFTGASALSDVEAALFDPRTGEIVFFQKLSRGMSGSMIGAPSISMPHSNSLLKMLKRTTR